MVCTKDQKAILANDVAHQALRNAWGAADAWLVGRYVVTPNHVHLFCAPALPDSVPVLKWVYFWKSVVARSWSRREQLPIWQRHFWDTQLRRSESYNSKREYVRQNPARAGFVARRDDWAYAGEMNVLRW